MRFLPLIIVICSVSISFSQSNLITEKTLVVRTSVSNLQQQGGSALTLDDGLSHFDGVVFGEIEKGKWMAGSDVFTRTDKDQGYVSETEKNQPIQISIVYGKNTISIYRNEEKIHEYPIEKLQAYNSSSSNVIFGKRHIDVGNPDNSFEGEIKEAQIYSRALSSKEISKLNAGESIEDALFAYWDFSKGIQEQTGSFKSFQLEKGARIENGSLILEGGGASLIASQNTDVSEWENTRAVPQNVIANTRNFRERLLNDPYRPAYHFAIPEGNGMPGDPNGAFYANGRYHLMYLYNREESGFSWGHISSTDLVHWRNHPDAIGPGDGDEGCFSGGAFVDTDGKAYLTYWMLWGDKGIGMASSKDEFFDKWEKLTENPVIKSTEWGITEMEIDGEAVHVGSADPSNIWKEGDTYFMLTGNLLVLNKYGRDEDSPTSEQGDRLYLFKSKDLKKWEYVHRFYESDRMWTEASEDNMCPSFFPLPKSPEGGEISDKHLLLFISHNMGCQYYIGDYKENRFFPETHGRMTWKDKSYFAPEALIDDKGRQIMWAWIFDDRPASMKKNYGWTGTYGLPRALWLGDDETLRMRPVEELKTLRYDEKSRNDIVIQPTEKTDFSGMSSSLMELEIKMTIEKDDIVTIHVAANDSGEETRIIYDDTRKELRVDTRNSGKIGKKVIEAAPIALREGEALNLRIFLDKSIVEVFANDRQAIGRRIYPSGKNNQLYISSENNPIKINTIKSWKMSPSNPY